MGRRRGPAGKSVNVNEDDALFILVWLPEATFVLIGGRNIVTEIGMGALILVCLINAFLVARQWKRHGRYS